MEIVAFVVGCLSSPPSLARSADDERERLAAALEREEADPVPRPAIVKLFRRHLPATVLSENLSAAGGLDGRRVRDPIPPATRLARTAWQAPRKPG